MSLSPEQCLACSDSLRDGEWDALGKGGGRSNTPQGLLESKVRKSQRILLHGTWHHNPHRCCMADLVLHSQSQAVPGHTE